MINSEAGPAKPGRTIKYAVIGYGVAGSQFVASLILERLILHWTNKAAGFDDSGHKIEVTAFSSQSSAEAGGGDAWGPEHDGFINSPIPPPLNLPGRENLQPASNVFVDLATDLPSEIGKAVRKDYEDLLAKLKATNQPGAAFSLGRIHMHKNSMLGVSRSYLGNVRRESLKAIIDFANNHTDYIKIDLKYDTWAVVSSLDDPKQPVVSHGPKGAVNQTTSFDKVLSFSGVGRTSIVPEELRRNNHVSTSSGNKQEVGTYLEARRYQEGQKVGFVGAKLSFIDCASVLGTHHGIFDFHDERPFCRPKDSINHEFIVFTRPNGKGITAKPRLSYTIDWPHDYRYLETEHILALRTQKNFDWVTKVQFVWRSMISYVLDRHPYEYPGYRTLENMEAKWKRFSKECETFRNNPETPTYCGLERRLVVATLNGYGAELNPKDAKRRVEAKFPAIFVSDERMYAASFAHVSSTTFLNAYQKSNALILRTLQDWYETLSGSPVEVCEPIFQLGAKGVLKHKEADVTKATLDGDKIKIGDEKLDVVFAPKIFGTGIDEVVGGVLPRLQQQYSGSTGAGKPKLRPIPVWQKLGQLVRDDDELVNVWDFGNNRGSGLPYKHTDSGGQEVMSKVRPRISVTVISAAYEFGPSIAACMLAHDLFGINGESDPSTRLQDAIKQEQQPSKPDYERQMAELETYYVEAMQRFHFLKAIAAEGDKDKWKEYYKLGLTEAGRKAALAKLKLGAEAQEESAERHQKEVKKIRRDAMDYDEWHAPFSDVDVSVAWRILQQASGSYYKRPEN